MRVKVHSCVCGALEPAIHGGTSDVPVHELTLVSDQPSSALKRWAQRQEIPLSAACKTVANPATHEWQTADRLRRFRDRQRCAVRRSANTHQRPATIDGWALGRRVRGTGRRVPRPTRCTQGYTTFRFPRRARSAAKQPGTRHRLVYPYCQTAGSRGQQWIAQP